MCDRKLDRSDWIISLFRKNLPFHEMPGVFGIKATSVSLHQQSMPSDDEEESVVLLPTQQEIRWIRSYLFGFMFVWRQNYIATNSSGVLMLSLPILKDGDCFGLKQGIAGDASAHPLQQEQTVQQGLESFNVELKICPNVTRMNSLEAENRNREITYNNMCRDNWRSVADSETLATHLTVLIPGLTYNRNKPRKKAQCEKKILPSKKHLRFLA